MTQLSPYLNFNGKCREAMTFYQHCLGGELTLQKLGESPMAAHMPSASANTILHSTLTREDWMLLGSDMIGKGLVSGNNVALCLHCNSDEEIEMVFRRLADGGQVKMPLHQTFWGATYGELTDRFGLNWVFNYTKSD